VKKWVFCYYPDKIVELSRESLCRHDIFYSTLQFSVVVVDKMMRWGWKFVGMERAIKFIFHKIKVM